jgi:hypothetical protein
MRILRIIIGGGGRNLKSCRKKDAMFTIIVMQIPKHDPRSSLPRQKVPELSKLDGLIRDKRDVIRLYPVQNLKGKSITGGCILQSWMFSATGFALAFNLSISISRYAT